MKIIYLLSLCSTLLYAGDNQKALTSTENAPKYDFFEPGKVWLDTEGNPISAHGAGFMYHEGVYYWYGETRQSFHSFPGFQCYSSTDLMNWKNEGIVLKPEKTDKSHDLYESNIIERPKVIYNSKTKKFVMWMHVDANDYSYSQAGVAVSDQPTGPYKYLGSVKPNGQMSRDMTLYKDTDERAYLIYASEANKTMQVCLLSDDYLSPTTTYSRITSAQNREAPALFKYNKKYYLITSDCTGWSPNPATYATADSLLGEWQQMGNPCTGVGADSTFNAQSSFVMPIPGSNNSFLFMADRWDKMNLPDSKYIWLPIKMTGDKPIIEWVK